MLPQLNSNTDLNKVQEMYLTGNMLGDSAMESLSGYQRMKVLHIAHNEIHNLYDRWVDNQVHSLYDRWVDNQVHNLYDRWVDNEVHNLYDNSVDNQLQNLYDRWVDN